MYPFFNTPFNPFGFPAMGFPFPAFVRRANIPRLDVRGIPVVSSTGLVENLDNETSADYGINPCVWRLLPCQSVILWKVQHPVSQNGASLPVTVVIPSGGNSTVISNGSSSGTTKIPVVDNKGTQVQGSDVTVPTGSSSGSSQQIGNTTEHWVYIDKSAGIFRLLGVTAQNSPTNASGGNTPAENSASKSK